jgi:hypothetical protein
MILKKTTSFRISIGENLHRTLSAQKNDGKALISPPAACKAQI